MHDQSHKFDGLGHQAQVDSIYFSLHIFSKEDSILKKFLKHFVILNWFS
jgi:hypothetical protein